MHARSFVFLLLSLGGCFAELVFPVVATAATVGGRVITSEGKPLPFAKVLVLGTRRGADTREDATFYITDVPEGRHTLRVQYPGFRPVTRVIQVDAGENRLADVILLVPGMHPPPVEVGSRARARAGDLVASINPRRGRFHVGDSPKFEVRIRNRGAAPTWLVRSVDASDTWASPRVTIEIEGPEGGFSPPAARGGTNEGVRREDFEEVSPGDAFDPFSGGWWPDVLRGTFTKPGTYRATFRYVTSVSDATKWVSGPCSDCDVPGEFRDLLEQVPAVDLTSQIEFRVD